MIFLCKIFQRDARVRERDAVRSSATRRAGRGRDGTSDARAPRLKPTRDDPRAFLERVHRGRESRGWDYRVASR